MVTTRMCTSKEQLILSRLKLVNSITCERLRGVNLTLSTLDLLIAGGYLNANQVSEIKQEVKYLLFETQ